MWDKLNNLEKFFSLIVVMGSIVDIFQFSWLIKKSYEKVKKSMYDKVRKDILISQYESIKHDDKGLFMGLEDDKKVQTESNNHRGY